MLKKISRFVLACGVFSASIAFPIYSFSEFQEQINLTRAKELVDSSLDDIARISEKTVSISKNFMRYSENKFKPPVFTRVSTLDLIDLQGREIAKIVPDEYRSAKNYTVSSSEVRSLLWIEDRTYLFRDTTMSTKGLIRALLESLGGGHQGASGITQQFVKNFVIKDGSYNLSRKASELIAGYYLERRFSKQDIAEMYLNAVSYGKNVYGIEQAGERYLGIKGRSLSIEEAFLLNSMLKQPSFYIKNPDKLKERATGLLKSYLQSIGFADYEIAESSLKLKSLPFGFERAPGFVEPGFEYIRDRGGSVAMKSQTSTVRLNYLIDPDQKRTLDEAISREEDENCKKFKACDLAAIVLDKEGRIRYTYSGKYEVSQVDTVFSGLELGSTMKPFLYAQYFTKFGNKTSVPNNQFCSGGYCPSNWNFSKSAMVSFRSAILLSYNLPVMHIVKDYIGLDNAFSMLSSLGLYDNADDLTKAGYTGLLGTMNSSVFRLARAYSIFHGNDPLSIGISGSGATKIGTRSPFSQEALQYISETLKGNELSKKWSIKTGTTSNFKDEWIVAFDKDFVIVVWMGNKTGLPTKSGMYSVAKGRKAIGLLFDYAEKIRETESSPSGNKN